MRVAQELIWGLVRMALVAAGALYSAQVLLTYARHESVERPQFDPEDKLLWTGRLMVWAGVMAVRTLVRLSRPFVNMLSEASAEVGEWAIARRHTPATIRTRVK